MTSSDELGSQRNAAQRLEPYKAQIAEWRLTQSADDVALQLSAALGKRITRDTIYRACAWWGVGAAYDLRLGNGGRQPKVKATRCAHCEILLAYAPEGDGALCGYCLAERSPREPWREWVCNVESAAIGAAGMGRMEL